MFKDAYRESHLRADATGELVLSGNAKQRVANPETVSPVVVACDPGPVRE
jgi:hypothetical protein